MKNHWLFLFLTPIVFALFHSCETNEFSEPGLLVPLTVTEDPSLPAIFVNNTLLHSEAFGDPIDPMIVVIHGGPGSDYRSMLNCKKFTQDGYYVVFYDQRGSGLSQRHDADIYTTQIFIDDLKAVIEYYHQDEEQKIILMGHSWGAMLATAYVNNFPEQISGVVMMEPGGFTWKDTEDYITRSRGINLFGENTNDVVYLDQFLTADDHNKLDYIAASSYADFLEGNKIGNVGPNPYWRSGAVCFNASLDYVIDHPFDFTTNLSQYTTKVLFAYSELSEAYGKEHAVLVSSAYPNVQLVEIAGTGHEIPYFGWENFYPIALNYLQEIN